MISIPGGTVTFLFTDIEGSTRLAQDFPADMHEALEKHNAILRDAIELRNGFIFDTAGDAFCSAFENAEDAVKAAVSIQKKLAEEKCLLSSLEENECVIKVRMGIHSGAAEWSGTNYMGYITLARTARVMSAAYGGQIIISENTHELCKGKFDSAADRQISFRDLGERRLKDLIQPLRLFQIDSSGLNENFPPLKTLDARPNNLPVQLTNFIGRDEEMKTVKNLIMNSRLITLTGPGGTGKTRLALQVGADVIDEFENGVWLVDLAPLLEAELLPQAIAQSLGITELPNQKVEDTLINFLKDKHVLIILDNCEHIVNACARLSESILKVSPKVKILTTSREALRCYGEQTHQTLSLNSPDTKEIVAPEQLVKYEAVRLFIERALAINPSFRVTNENAHAIAGICFQLDGIPLAIELAAARINVLSAEKIYSRINDRFKLLTVGKRTALPRQKTLSATIDWSYDLLSGREKSLWNRLSVFSGGWTLEACEKICSDDDTIPEEDILDLITNLADKSIIVFDKDKQRYRMLETIRQYGNEKLQASAAGFENFNARHLKYFLELAEKMNTMVRSDNSVECMRIMENEKANMEKALIFSLDLPESEDCMNLAWRLAFFWRRRGYISEGIKWLDAAKNRGCGKESQYFHRVISELGNFLRTNGDLEKARKYFEESLKLCMELNDKVAAMQALNRLGLTEYDSGRYEEAAEFYERGMEVCDEIGYKLGKAISLNNLGNIASNLGDYDKATKLYEESLTMRREMKDNIGIAVTLNNIGIIAYERGDYKRAAELIQESLEIRIANEDSEGISICNLNLGNNLYNQGEYEKASVYYNESLKINKESGDKTGIADSLFDLGKAATGQGMYEKALEFFQESLAVSLEVGAKSIEAVNLHYLGRDALRKKDYELSRKFFSKSMNIFYDSHNRRDTALNILSIAELEFYLGNFANALRFAGLIKKEFFEARKIRFAKIDQLTYDEICMKLKESVNEEEYDKYFYEGTLMSLDTAIKLALKIVS